MVNREVFENRGAMFNQTVYKASDNGSKKLIPKKDNFDTAIYGGYSGKTLAYLSIVKVATKNGFEYQVIGVPTIMLARIHALMGEGLSQKVAVKQLLPLCAKLDQKKWNYQPDDYEVVLPQVRFEQVVRDNVKGQTHRFSLGTDTYYHNIQELHLSLGLQRKVSDKKLDSDKLNENLIEVYDETLKQLNEYFVLYDLNQFRKKVNESREDFLRLKPKDEINGQSVVAGKGRVLENIFMGAHANATVGDLKTLGIKTPLGKLQVPGGLKLTKDAEMIYQSPTGLFERKVALKDL